MSNSLDDGLEDLFVSIEKLLSTLTIIFTLFNCTKLRVHLSLIFSSNIIIDTANYRDPELFIVINTYAEDKVLISQLITFVLE